MTDTITDDELFGPPTPEQKARAKAIRERIMARDWHEVPKGHYAIPVRGYVDWDLEGEDAPVIGYRLFERRTPRTYKNGRIVGRDQFIHGRTMVVPGADPDEVSEEIRIDRQAAAKVDGPDAYLKETIDRIMLDVERQDTFRAMFGRLTGKCGHCGKALTDPKSKMIGIGPDCRGYR